MVRIFAHRGYKKDNIKENSIQSLIASFENNFLAIEFDIWYIKSQSHSNHLVLKHDLPLIEEIDKLDKLESYFLYENKFDYWLDFKNLNSNNCKEALEEVRKIIFLKKIDLKKIYFAPFITDLNLALVIYKQIREIFGIDANIMAVCENLPENGFKNYSDILRVNKIKFVSIRHDLINSDSITNFADLTLFAWTVNDWLRLEELRKMGVNNFASDKLVPVTSGPNYNLNLSKVVVSN